MNKNILICIPCYQGSCQIETMKDVIELTHILRNNEINYEIFTLQNESLISRGRNICASYLLINSSFSHLLFIDSDIVFSPENVITMLHHNKDIIAGIYPSKTINLKLLKDNVNNYESVEEVLHNSTKNVGIFDPECNEKILKKMLYVPTGFLMVKRHVFEKLSTSQSLQYINDVPNYNQYTHGKKAYNFFQTGIINKKLLSEDYGFCLLCRNSGFELFCDVTMNLYHIGNFKF